MNEKDFRALLIRATEDRPAGIDLMPVMPAMPKRRPSRVLVPIASLGVAAAAGAIVLVVPVGQSSAQAQVAAAAENTSQESYRLHTTSGPRTWDGAFDPVHHVGVITQVGDGAETRFVGDLMYVKEQQKGKWTVSPRPEAELASAPEVIALVKLAELEPQAALQRLRSATDVRESGPASGQGWTGRRFVFSLEDAGDSGSKEAWGDALKVTGAVNVDDQARVRRLEIAFSDNGERNVMEFNDFGTPVTVTAPPADQVVQPPDDKQSGKPTDQAQQPPDDRRSGKPTDQETAKPAGQETAKPAQ
jgi:hypothetical protein